MNKTIEITSNNDINSEDMIVESANTLFDLYQTSSKINRIRIDVDYIPLHKESVNEAINDLYKALQDDPIVQTINLASSIVPMDTMIKSLMIATLNYYHNMGWIDKDTFREFAEKFTSLYRISVNDKEMDEYVFDYDEIGNYLTLNGMGYNVPGGFSIRKLHTGSEKPYIIDRND